MSVFAKTFFGTFYMKTIDFKTKQVAAVIATTAVLLTVSSPVFAGTGGTEFTAAYDLLVGWSQGTLGKVIATGMFLVGLAAGIIKQSVASAVTGIGGAMVLSYGPGVIESVFTALI